MADSATLVSKVGIGAAPSKKAQRLPVLDFIKGTLVLIMVLYHWMNYFLKVDGSIYRYLRFLTPSFIFVTGFLIAHVYLTRMEPWSRQIPRRLLVRGLKLLGIVAFLNAALATVAVYGFGARLSASSMSTLLVGSLTGTTSISFSVLVPIAYLLIVAGGLLIPFWRFRQTFHIACAVAIVSALLLDVKGVDSSYLQLLAIGTLGISMGSIPIGRINQFMSYPIAICGAYSAYLGAITLWDATFLLQIIGVCLSIAIIYLMGVWCGQSNYVGRTAVLLGQYSLFGYIVQIFILQALRKGLQTHGSSLAVPAAAFVAGVTCTVLSVKVLDHARKRLRTVNNAYGAVFC